MFETALEILGDRVAFGAGRVAGLGEDVIALAGPAARVLLVTDPGVVADGKLTQSEIDAARRDRLAKFDDNNDGKLSLEEYQDLWLDAMRERMVDRFQKLDADGDAVVTVYEFGQPFEKMVERRDRDGDGELTAADFRRLHHEKDREDGEDKD